MSKQISFSNFEKNSSNSNLRGGRSNKLLDESLVEDEEFLKAAMI
jgi:hypothetical protein